MYDVFVIIFQAIKWHICMYKKSFFISKCMCNTIMYLYSGKTENQKYKERKITICSGISKFEFVFSLVWILLPNGKRVQHYSSLLFSIA